MKEKIVEILEDKKVEDIAVIDVRQKSAMFDYFVIGTIDSNKQTDAVIYELKKSSVEVHHIEETEDGGWILIDCYDVVIHLFDKQKRAEYDLESLWKDTIKTLHSKKED